MSTPSSRKTRIIGSLRRLGIWLAVLLTWEAAYRAVGWQAVKFPAPSHILDATFAMLGVRSGFAEPLSARWPRPEPFDDARPDSPFNKPIYMSALVQANLVSATRLSIGFAISILLGTVIGLGMWRSAELDKLLGGLFLGFQTLPSVCWVPLGIIVFGLTESAVLFVLVMGSFFAVAIALRDGLRTIPPIYQRAGQMLGAGGWKLYYYVLLPAALPAMVGSLRQGFSFAWRSLMGAELILAVSNHGLGALLELGRVNGDPPQVLAVMIVMVLIGMAADRYVFARLQERVQARFGLGG